MKHILLIFILCSILPSPAASEERIHLDISVVQKEVIARYAEDRKWCDQKPDTPKDGQIIIFWVRDDDGRCVIPQYIVADREQALWMSVSP